MARSKWGEEDEGFVLGEKMLTGDHREKKLMEMNTRSRCEDIVIASYLKKKNSNVMHWDRWIGSTKNSNTNLLIPAAVH